MGLSNSEEKRKTSLSKESYLLCGLSSIKGLSGRVIEQIIDLRPFKDFPDFSRRVKISQRELGILLAAGAFEPWSMVVSEDDGQLNLFEKGKIQELKTELSVDDVLPFRKESSLNRRDQGLISLLTKSLGKRNDWNLEEIKAGDFSGLPSLGVIQARNVSSNLKDCQKCQLRKGCSGPVGMEKGKYNLMIVGEAPGREEDAQGSPFIGKAGQLLFKNLSRLNFEREDFYISNVVKCYPRGKPSLADVGNCGDYLAKEIRAVRPVAILSLGNIARLFFSGKESGVLEANGTVVWSDRFQVWIVYSIHPAMVLYHRENKGLLEESLVVFKSLVRYLV